MLLLVVWDSAFTYQVRIMYTNLIIVSHYNCSYIIDHLPCFASEVDLNVLSYTLDV